MKWQPSAIDIGLSKAYEVSKEFGDRCCAAIADEINRIRSGRLTDEEKAMNEAIKIMAEHARRKLESEVAQILLEHDKGA